LKGNFEVSSLNLEFCEYLLLEKYENVSWIFKRSKKGLEARRYWWYQGHIQNFFERVWNYP
jgi:hypothetical protein